MEYVRLEKSKACSVCKQIKPNTEFNKNRRLKSGLSSECKVCKSIADANYRAKNKQKIASNHKRWSVKNKEHILARNIAWRKANPERYKAAQQKSAIKNRPKKRLYNKEWSAANKVLHRQMIADWQKRNPESNRRSANKRRAKVMATRHEIYTENQVIEKYGTDCHLCHLPIDFDAPRRVGRDGWEKGLHIEHLVPIDKGGPDILDNVRPSHGLCNLRKGAR
jgi:hypothetical protein